MLKHFTARKRYVAFIFVIIITSIIATFILNSLISDEIDEVRNDIAQRSFYKKREGIKNEFKALQWPLRSAQDIIRDVSGPTAVLHNLSILSSLQRSDSSLVKNWFGLIKNDSLVHIELQDGVTVSPEETGKLVGSHQSDTIQAYVFQTPEHRVIWRQIRHYSKDQLTYFYGYDLDLKVVQKLFWNTDVYSQSYAYVFDEKGTCMLHPNLDLIGTNVYQSTQTLSGDTLLNLDDYNKKIAQSEYLNLDVINYLQPLNLPGGNYYVSINFPKSINEQDIDLIKKYSLIIYILSTVLVLFVFYYFTRALNIDFKEREKLRQEKDRLVLEKETIQKESALLQLQQLKERVNPHFLFNSLNSLYTLIDLDSNLSKKFTIELSKLYRYLIQSPQGDLSGIRVELDFIEKYLFLQKTRFRDALHFEITIEDTSGLNKKIPYLSLQTVVENAIKHNRVSVHEPLYIGVVINGNYIDVKNTFQLKEGGIKSENFGLKYLNRIYRYYGKEDISLFQQDSMFICRLPLLTD